MTADYEQCRADWHRAYWTPERYAQFLRAGKALGARVYEPNTMPELTDEELARIVESQPNPPMPLPSRLDERSEQTQT